MGNVIHIETRVSDPVYWMNSLDNFKSLLFLFDVKRPINVLDPEKNSPDPDLTDFLAKNRIQNTD